MSEIAARIRPREVAFVATDTRLRGLSLKGENLGKTKEFASLILFKLFAFYIVAMRARGGCSCCGAQFNCFIKKLLGFIKLIQTNFVV